MTKDKQLKLAEEFHNLHNDNHLFILPNAWDSGSAVVFEKQGFKAIGTTSAGIAYSLGLADGEKLKFEDLLYTVKHIIRRISVPLSVDFERGYSKDPDEVKENAGKLIELGAVGLNIEDGLEDGSLESTEIQIKKIEAIISLKNETGIPFVLNARSCSCWGCFPNQGTIDTAIERAELYRNAGADCIFIPGILDLNSVTRLVKNIDAPLNIIANPVFNDISKMNEIGVKRLSLGSGAVRSAYNHLMELSQDIYDSKITSLFNHSFSYSKSNAFFGNT